MNEVDVQAPELRLELRKAVEPRFAGTPIVASRPIIDDLLEIGLRNSLGPVIHRFRLGPPRRKQAAPEILEIGLRRFDPKRPDIGHQNRLDASGSASLAICRTSQ